MSSVEKQLFAKRNHQMEELMDWTRPLSLKEQEQVLAEAREKNWRDRMAREDYVFEQGLAEGKEEGLKAGKAEGLKAGKAEGMQKGLKAGKAEGMQKGMEKGIEKGMEARNKEIVLNMLKKSADIAFISEVTGLSIKEIKKLKNSSE